MRTIPFVALCAASTLVGCSDSELAERRAEVAAAGREVMPFDLERTTHLFAKTDRGGVQTVTADDRDAEQVALVRAHLRSEAERFARGDFHDPEAIHGADMPGLHALVVGHERLSITYRDIEDGAEIRYETDDPALVEAVHAWFDAQVSDHGDHAQAH